MQSLDIGVSPSVREESYGIPRGTEVLLIYVGGRYGLVGRGVRAFDTVVLL